MKLYFAPEACSLAGHIALLEVGCLFDIEAVDLKSKTTASGLDFRTINAKGYVPALVLDSGEMLTENVAVLDWIATQHTMLAALGPLGRTRQLEALAYISTELHTGFKPMWHNGSEDDQENARIRLAGRFAFLESTLQGKYLFGERPGVADCYLYVMLRWAGKFRVALPARLRDLHLQMDQRPAVRAALAREDLALHRKQTLAPVQENKSRSRFERSIATGATALACYRLDGETLEFFHTEVPAAYSGLGIATELARGTFDLLRQSHRKAVLTCPFMQHFLASNPEYADVVAA